MKLSVEEIDELFAVDAEDRFIKLVLPNDKLGDEVNLIGKKRLDLDLDTIVRIKKYANKLYEEALR